MIPKVLLKRYETILLLILAAAIFEGGGTWAIKEGYLQKDPWYLAISVLFFTGVVWMFYKVYHYEKMSIVNAYYNAFSFVIITAVGVFMFGEKLSLCEKIGLALIFAGVLVMTMDELGRC